MPKGEGPRTETIVLPFAGGLDQKTAEQYLDPSRNQIEIINGNFSKVGAIDKRLGLQFLPNTLAGGPTGTTQLVSAIRGASYSGAGGLIFSQQGLYTVDQAAPGTVGVGPLPAIKATRKPMTSARHGTDTTFAPIVQDVPFNGRLLRVAVYLVQGVSDQMFGTVFDADSGDVYVSPTLLYAGLPVPIQILFLGGAPIQQATTIIFVDQNPAIVGNNIFAIQFNPTTNAFGAPVGILRTAVRQAGNSQNGAVDAMPWYPPASNTADTFVVAYHEDPGGPTAAPTKLDYAAIKYDLVTVVSSGTVATAPALAFAKPSTSVYVFASQGGAEFVWFQYAWQLNDGNWTYAVTALKGDGTWALQTTRNIFTDVALNLYLSGALRLTADHVLIVMWEPNNPPTDITPMALNTWIVSATTGILPGQPNIAPIFMMPISRPFMAAGRPSMQALLYMSASSLQYTVYTLSLMQATVPRYYVTATVAPRQALFTGRSAAQAALQLFHVPAVSGMNGAGTQTRSAFGFNLLGPSEGVSTLITGAFVATNAVAEYTWDAAAQNTLYQTAELAGELHVSAGVPMVFDGTSLVEDNFFYYPETTTVGSTGSGSGLTGTYGYAVHYSRVDGAGLRHVGAPVFLSTVIAGNFMFLEIPTYDAGYPDFYRIGSVVAEIYRTLANGNTYFFRDSIVVSGVGPTILWPPSPPGDNAPDATIATSPQLYTTGGVLDNVNAPSSNGLTVYGDRVVSVDDTLQNVWLTQQSGTQSPGLAPGFNDQVLVIPYPDGGDITAVRVLDSYLVVFKAGSIWISSGTGPSTSGVGATYSQPQQVPSGGVGCSNERSCVLTPVGIMFQAPDNNIYLLTRSLEVQFIGKNVTDSMQRVGQVLSATLVPLAQQVRFAFTFAGVTSGTIVYDYFLQQWTQHEYIKLSALVQSTFITAQSPQRYSVLTADGHLWQERLAGTSLAYQDQDTASLNYFVPTSITTPWVKFNGPQNVQDNQRVRVLQLYGKQQDPCGIEMKYAVDYDPTIVGDETWTSDQLATLHIPGQVMAGVSRLYNRCQAIQVTVLDSAGLGESMATGQGMQWVNLAIELQSVGKRWGILPVQARR